MSSRLLYPVLCTGVALFLSACESSAPAKQADAQKPATNMGERIDRAMETAIQQAENADTPQEAVAIYEELRQIKPNDPVLAVKYARALRDDEQLNKALTVLHPHTQGENANPEALTEQAMTYLALGEYKKAELSARETIATNAENGRAFLALGTALDAQGYHEQAETAFRRGIEYWRGDPAPILNNLALNLASQGKLDEAIGVLTRAREISPHRVEIERNYRIISTLRETAIPPAPKPSQKPDAPFKPQPVSVKAEPMKVEPEVKEVKKEEEKKPEVKTIEVKAKEPVPPKEEEPEAKAKQGEATEPPVRLKIENSSKQSWKSN